MAVGGGTSQNSGKLAQVAAGGVDGGATEGAAVRWPPWSKRGRHGRRRYSDSVVDKRGPHGFRFFLNYPN
jgi:hypothetical protein